MRLRGTYRTNSKLSSRKNDGFSDFSVISSCKTAKNKLLPIDFRAKLS